MTFAKYCVSNDWATKYGLLAKIIGAVQYLADNSLLPMYVAPV